MAHTNQTEHYELSQFLATDKPAWLTDYNTDMVKIDGALDDIQKQVTDNKADFDAAETEMDRRVSICEVALTVCDDRETALEGRMDSAETRLDVDEANITTDRNRIGVLEGKVDDLENGHGLAPNSITTAMIKDGSITTDKLALGSVTTDEILNGTIQYEDLSEDCIDHFDPTSSAGSNILKNIVNALYPVGSVYLSMGVNPNTLFIGTTWTRVTGGVLYTGNGSNDGSTIGHDNVTLNSNNIPQHRHTVTPTGSVSISGGSAGVTGGSNGWSSGVPKMKIKGRHSTNDSFADIGCSGLNSASSGTSYTGLAGYSGVTPDYGSMGGTVDADNLVSGSFNHTHNIDLSGITGSLSLNTVNTDYQYSSNPTAISVKQAGVNVSVWKRTA